MKQHILFSIVVTLFILLLLSGPALAANYDINNVGDFLNITNDLGGNYTLNADLDFTSVTFTSLGTQTAPFKGTFNGNGFNISNLTYNGTGTQYVGLFGYAENATFDNFVLRNFDVMGQQYVGTLVGFAVNSSISNIHVFDSRVAAIEEGSNYGKAGGIVGCLDSGSVASFLKSKMVYCSADSVEILAHIDGGGLIGCIGEYGNVGTPKTTEVSQCYFNGTVKVSHHSAGGIVGTNFGGHIKNCYAIGSVICAGDGSPADDARGLAAGGIIGNMQAGTIDGCFFSGYLEIHPENAASPNPAYDDFLGSIGIIFSTLTGSSLYDLLNDLDNCPFYLTDGTNLFHLNPGFPPLTEVNISVFKNLGWSIRDVSDTDGGETWVFDNGNLRFNWSYVPSATSSSGGSSTGSASVVNSTSDTSNRIELASMEPSVSMEPSDSSESFNPTSRPADSEPPILNNSGLGWWVLALIVGFVLFAGIVYDFWKKKNDESA